MKLAKFFLADGQPRMGLVDGDLLAIFPSNERYANLSQILEADDPAAVVLALRHGAKTAPVSEVKLLAPIDRQEVWAAGVTYRRSQVARMEESQGAASFYDKVYVAARPELFFKATPHRVSGPREPLRIRQDAHWSVPEPELALVLNSRGTLVGFTVGNDMSSRDIEGENPLYLPQAKVYDRCCGLGPWITLAAWMPEPDHIGIRLKIVRGEEAVFEGQTSVAQLARTFADLASWLWRENSFPEGVFLLTGTGIVPADDFTLAPGDRVEISIDGIGSLVNPIIRG